MLLSPNLPKSSRHILNMQRTFVFLTINRHSPIRSPSALFFQPSSHSAVIMSFGAEGSDLSAAPSAHYRFTAGSWHIKEWELLQGPEIYCPCPSQCTVWPPCVVSCGMLRVCVSCACVSAWESERERARIRFLSWIFLLVVRFNDKKLICCGSSSGAGHMTKFEAEILRCVSPPYSSHNLCTFDTWPLLSLSGSFTQTPTSTGGMGRRGPKRTPRDI